jgi:hypothetical protein
MAKRPEPSEWLSRYQSGEHEAVWAEMTALGLSVRQAPYAEHAEAVARETMRRARHNVELIIQRLDRLGYEFWDGTHGPSSSAEWLTVPPEAQVERLLAQPGIFSQIPEQMRGRIEARVRQTLPGLLKGDRSSLPGNAGRSIEQLLQATRQLAERARPMLQQRDEQLRRKREITDHLEDGGVFSPPTTEGIAWIRELEEKGLTLPLCLRAWAEQVGDVNLAGAHPRLSFWEGKKFPGVYADPLMVTLDHLELQAEGWLEEHEAGDDPESLEVVIGWDAKVKARLAIEDELLDYGYTVELPNPTADIALDGEPHKTTFVGYLRIAFRWGGFPGWERQKERPEKELKFLTDGLLPI